MSNALIHTLDLLDEIQIERGIALLPAHIREQIEALPFDTQAARTYATLTTTQKNYPDFWALLPESFFNAFAQRNNETFRNAMSLDQLREWYGFNLEQPIYQMALSYLTNHPYFNPSQMSALIHYIAALSYLHQLRDLGVTVYTKAEITPTDTSRLKNAAASYLARERLYLGLADENLRQIIDEARTTTPGISAEIDQILRKIKDGYAKGVLASTSVQDWIERFNRELSNLQQALTISIQKLAAQALEISATKTQNQSLDSDIEHNLHSIRTLPLFRGLSEVSLRNILKGARLIELDKNSPFMTQGEATTRFYIIVDGWAKTTKTTAEGQESIIQILGKKECLLDVGYISADIATVNGRAITKCKILALSLSVLRDHASRNRELAQNLLTATTTRLQKLVTQFEQMTLRTATQRVGWFLVNLHLETGLEGAPLKLPFDKSLIAAYLNIKPETLSRVLKEFRERGFVINKDEIILPTPDALCSFCDPEMASRCCRAEATNCIPIQTARRTERQ